MTKTITNATDAVKAPELEVRGLGIQRGERALFSDLNMRLGAGQALLVSGVNGAGKTTLLRTLCGLSMPAQGQVLWGGEDIHTLREDYHAQVLYLGHRNGNKDELTCDENLEIALGTAGRPSTPDERRRALVDVGLGDRQNLAARHLSQGQQRRLALARLHLTQATLWVLDEPFNALDTEAIGWLEDRLAQHLSGGGLAIFTSHFPVKLNGSLARLHIGDR